MQAEVKLWVVSYDPYHEPYEDYSMPNHIIKASRCAAEKYCDDLNKKEEEDLFTGWWRVTLVEHSGVKDLTC
jgi:hypothetical protein